MIISLVLTPMVHCLSCFEVEYNGFCREKWKRMSPNIQSEAKRGKSPTALLAEGALSPIK